ncbi:MAG TPA: hypothetical protein VKA46_39825 [Gemmataceae bacterium]|nr:hypothetical protein [Gemmataceae bacterium]
MSAGVLVPVSMPAEARELIQELGLRGPVEEMIEHTRQAVAGLRSIEIEAWYEHEEDRTPLPHVTVIGWRDGHRSAADDVTEREWFEWAVRTYPPEVKLHLSFALQCLAVADIRARFP